MAKKSKHVRRFLNAATARRAEAAYLQRGGFSLAAVYLAGYAVECTLKALVLSALDDHEQRRAIDQFRGVRAHDYGWLLTLYREYSGIQTPTTVTALVSELGVWETSLRYTANTRYDGDEDEFFTAVEHVLGWANRRV